MGRARRMAAIATLAGFLASLTLAVPARAVTSQTVTVSYVPSTFTVSPLTVSLTVGDTLAINNTSALGLAIKNGSGQIRNVTSTVCASVASTSAGSSCPVTATATTSFTVLATGTVEIYNFAASAVLINTVTIGSGGGGGSGGSSNSSSTSAGNSGPASVLQQFAKPTTGTCDAAQPTGLNWSGVASGGWSESWAQWANGGRGGSVCTRTLGYSSGWAVVN